VGPQKEARPCRFFSKKLGFKRQKKENWDESVLLSVKKNPRNHSDWVSLAISLRHLFSLVQEFFWVTMHFFWVWVHFFSYLFSNRRVETYVIT
jgi:hypothetical protein